MSEVDTLLTCLVTVGLIFGVVVAVLWSLGILSRDRKGKGDDTTD